MNSTIALNFIRSANAPQISAGVMMKNMPWNSMCVSRGISGIDPPPYMGSTGAVCVVPSCGRRPS